MRVRAHLTLLAGTTITIVAVSGLPAGAAPLPARPGAAAPAVGGALFAVSTDSPPDAWAVGRLQVQGSPVVLHWDGIAWRRVTIPSTARKLFGVSAISPTHAWAVRAPGRSTLPTVLH